MTKRLFAIVLAAILAITMFTFPVAAANVNAALTNDGSRLKLSYTSGESVTDCNKVVINYLRGNSIAKTVTFTSATDLKKDAHDYATTVGGEYSAQVFWYNGSVLIDSATTTTVTVPITTTGTNMKVVYDDKGITLEFTAQKNVTTYKIEYTYKSGNSTINGNPVAVQPAIDGNKATCKFTPICSYSDLVSIKIYAGANGGWVTNNFASWTNRNNPGSGSSTTSGNLNITGSIDAYIQNNYLNVSVNDTQYSYYRYAVIYSSTTTPSYSYLNYTRSFQVPVNNLYYTNGFTLIVEGSNTYNQGQIGWQAVGTVTAVGYNTGWGNTGWGNLGWGNTGWGNTGWGSYGVQFNTSNGVVTATWNAISGAMGYYVTYTTAANVSNTTSTPYNYCQLPFSTTDTGYRVEVRAVMSDNSIVYVGTAYANNASSSGNTSGITKTQIKNLTITPTSSISTSLSWSKYSGAAYYYIIYGGLDGTNLNENLAYQNSISIPYGSNTAYQATVYAMNSAGQRIATVGYVYYVPGTTADADKPAATGKDYPSNLTAKSANKKITLSWKAAEDATSYTIYYKRATSSSWNKISQKISKTAVNITGLTNNIEYDFKVVPNKGSESGIVTIAPSASSSRTVTAKNPSSSSSGDGDVSLDDEELTITSVSSSSKGKIKITWNDVDAPSYKIYVAEGTSNTYKPCGTYTGTSATISTFGTGSSATSFKSGKTYKVRMVRTDYTGSLKDALKACPYKTVTVK